MRLRTFIFILLFICGSASSYAQRVALIDSLKKAFSQTPDTLGKIQLLNQIGFEYRLSYPDSTVFYCQIAYSLGLKGYPDHLSTSLSFLGLANAYMGKSTKAFEYYQMAVKEAINANDSLQLAYSYNNLGRLFFDQGDFARSFNYLNEGLVLMEQLDDLIGISYVYRSLANIYKFQGDIERALEASLKALDYRLKTDNYRLILSSYQELALVYQSLGMSNMAIISFSKADSIAKAINDEVSQAELNLALAEMHIDNGMYAQGLSEVEIAKAIIQKLNNVRLMPKSKLLEAEARFYLNEMEKSKALLTELESLINENEQPALSLEMYFLRAKIAERQNQRLLKLDYENKYLILNEKLKKFDLEKEIQQLQFRLEIEQIEKENELLKANEEKIQSQINTEKFQRVVLSVGILILLVFSISLILINRKRRRAIKILAEQRDFIDRQRSEISYINQQISEQNYMLSKRNNELDEINNEKDTLMNIVAHDLKSPLHRISGLVHLVELSGPLTDEQTKAILKMKEVANAGLELIGDLLEVNEIEFGKKEIKWQQLQLEELINERISFVEEAAKKKKIRIQTKFENLPSLESDPALLGRIVDNLLSNAIKFSPEKSNVLIETLKRESKIEIHIIDNGPGFSDEDKKWIFQKFRKLSARPTAGESSNGLGLAIVKILADRLKIDIDLISEPEKGSRFVLSFNLPS